MNEYGDIKLIFFLNYGNHGCILLKINLLVNNCYF